MKGRSLLATALLAAAIAVPAGTVSADGYPNYRESYRYGGPPPWAASQYKGRHRARYRRHRNYRPARQYHYEEIHNHYYSAEPVYQQNNFRYPDRYQQAPVYYSAPPPLAPPQNQVVTRRGPCDSTSQIIGTLLGGGAGGFAANQAARGSRNRNIWTAGGALLGAVTGGLLGRDVDRGGC